MQAVVEIAAVQTVSGMIPVQSCPQLPWSMSIFYWLPVCNVAYVSRKGCLWGCGGRGGGSGPGSGTGGRLFSTSALSREPNDCCMDAGFVRCRPRRPPPRAPLHAAPYSDCTPEATCTCHPLGRGSRRCRGAGRARNCAGLRSNRELQ